MIADENISMVQGDTLSFGIQLFEDEAQTIPLSQDLDTAYFTCRQNDADLHPIFQKTLSNGITKMSAGAYVIRVAPEDTMYIDAGAYKYDFEIGLNNDVFTLLKGTLIIEQDVSY